MTAFTDAAAAAQEARTATYYNDTEHGGEGAGAAFAALMHGYWHHGLPAAEAAGESQVAAKQELDRRLLTAAGIAQHSGGWGLDFGSGPGGATCTMAQWTGGHFLGVSSADDLTQLARAEARRQGVADRALFLTIEPDVYRTLHWWPDECFSVVTAFESVCHLPRPEAFFSAAWRVLKQGAPMVLLDWVRRPWGARQSTEAIDEVIAPVCESYRLAELRTLEQHAAMLTGAGFRVLEVTDLFEGELCLGSAPAEEAGGWLDDSSPLIRQGKLDLDRARDEGVFSVGYLIAEKPITG